MAKESRKIRFIHGRTFTQNDVWNTVGAEIDVGDGSVAALCSRSDDSDVWEQLFDPEM